MFGSTDHNHRPFLAMAVIWGSMFLALVAVAPAIGGYALAELAQPLAGEEVTAERPDTRAQSLAESRRRQAMTPPTIAQDPADMRIAVRQGTRGY